MNLIKSNVVLVLLLAMFVQQSDANAQCNYDDMAMGEFHNWTQNKGDTIFNYETSLVRNGKFRFSFQIFETFFKINNVPCFVYFLTIGEEIFILDLIPILKLI